MKVPPGIQFVPAQNGKHFRKMCVGSDESKTISSVYIFSELGNHHVVGNKHLCSKICSPNTVNPLTFPFLNK